MKTLILSYSFTGNNKLLAETLAKEIGAEHISIQDKREVSVKSIMMDLIFHRKAKNIEQPQVLDNYDFIIYVAPFWVGKIARPLLPFFRHQKKNPKKYAFVTVSGGALGKNTKFTKELYKSIGSSPSFTKEFYTVDLIDEETKSTKETSTYIINNCLISKIEYIIIWQARES